MINLNQSGIKHESYTHTHNWTQTYIDMYMYILTQKLLGKIITSIFQTILPHTQKKKNLKTHIHTQREK